jgi:small conductance mechanosensitive channel
MEDQINDAIKILTEKLSGWMDLLVTNLPNMILALLLFGLSYAISQKLHNSVYRILRTKVKQQSIRSLVANFVSITVIAIGIFLALSILNLDKALTSILAGAGVAGLAVGLALQGTISNTFSGVFLAIHDIMNVGDFIETNGYDGTVEEITLRYVVLREADNNLIIIPNKLVVDNPFKNYGLTDHIRTSIKCGVGYESDLRSVKNMSIEIIEEAFPQGDKDIEFQYLEFGDSSINFQIRFWVPATRNLTLLEAKSEAIILLKEKFDAEGINIPYPITTIRSDD